MYKKPFPLIFIIVSFATSMVACNTARTSVVPAMTQPAISLEITGDVCPSVRDLAGTQIAWTNEDNIDRILLIKRSDDNGTLVDSRGTDLFQPGTTFSITLTEPGKYTYYCSKDRTVSGTITVLP